MGSGGGRGFVASGNVGGGSAADETGLKNSSIDMGSHLPVLFNSSGLCCCISNRLSAITCTSRSRRSGADNWHQHNVMVVETSTIVVVEFVVIVERHFMVMVMGWWLVWKL